MCVCVCFNWGKIAIVDTQIRALLTPHPMKEIRLKGSYERHESIKGAQGIKIAAQNLENTVAGMYPDGFFFLKK